MCKNLKIIKSDDMFYQQMSHQLRKFLKTKIPVLETYSIDEFFGGLPNHSIISI